VKEDLNMSVAETEDLVAFRSCYLRNCARVCPGNIADNLRNYGVPADTRREQADARLAV
jgi:hypothetical protein